jgi:hypothetical protein
MLRKSYGGSFRLAEYKKLRELLGEMFPEAYDLALKRIMAGQTIFFDHDNQPLFSEEIIFGALLIAHAMVAKFKLQLRMVARENRIWRRRFLVPLQKK